MGVLSVVKGLGLKAARGRMGALTARSTLDRPGLEKAWSMETPAASWR